MESNCFCGDEFLPSSSGIVNFLQLAQQQKNTIQICKNVRGQTNISTVDIIGCMACSFITDLPKYDILETDLNFSMYLYPFVYLHCIIDADMHISQPHIDLL